MFPRGNLARGGAVHRYRLEEATVDLDEGGFTTVPLFVLEGAGVGIDLEAAMRPAPAKRGPSADALEHAKEWLSLALVEAVPQSNSRVRPSSAAFPRSRCAELAKELGVETRPRSAANGKRRWWVENPRGSSNERVSPYPPLRDRLESDEPEIPGIEPNSEDAHDERLSPRRSNDHLQTDDHEE